MDYESIICEVLDKAWEKFSDENGNIPYEKDGDFEEFIVEELINKGANGVVWYSGFSNCHFVVNFNGTFLDVDYVSYKIEELDEEEAIRRASWGTFTQEEAKELLGLTN